MQVILGLDIGEKRIGVAVGDSAVKIASPYGIVAMGDSAVAEIQQLADKLRVATIVVGLPRNAAGEETRQSAFSRDFAEKLRPLGLPIVLQDESLTSVMAADMLSSQQRSKKHNKQQIDAMAASLILSDYLEANYG